MTRWLRRYCTANSECHLGRRSAGCWVLVVLSLIWGKEGGASFLSLGTRDSQTSRLQTADCSRPGLCQ